MIILIDNGHGENCNGKMSPLLEGTGLNISSEFTNKGRFREWKYNRVISHLIVDKMIPLREGKEGQYHLQ